jgi:putative photosynthetic complex assembly protein
MNHTIGPRGFPKAPLILLGALVLASLLGTAAVRWSGVDIREPDAPAVAVRLLRFEDRPDGSIAVLDGRDGSLVETVQGEHGFLRGTLRGLARERRMRGLGPEQPFELIARKDGRLTLLDPATQQRIDLDSFGPTNARVYARWVPAPANGR